MSNANATTAANHATLTKGPVSASDRNEMIELYAQDPSDDTIERLAKDFGRRMELVRAIVTGVKADRKPYVRSQTNAEMQAASASRGSDASTPDKLVYMVKREADILNYNVELKDFGVTFGVKLPDPSVLSETDRGRLLDVITGALFPDTLEDEDDLGADLDVNDEDEDQGSSAEHVDIPDHSDADWEGDEDLQDADQETLVSQ